MRFFYTRQMTIVVSIAIQLLCLFNYSVYAIPFNLSKSFCISSFLLENNNGFTENAESSNYMKIVLPKNIQIKEGVKKNILTQDMFYCANVDDGHFNSRFIFIIKYEFDLDGETIVLPDKCILKFDRGSLCNGTIIGSYSTYEGHGFGDNLIYKDFVKYSKGVIRVEELANSSTASNIDNYNNYNIAEIINYTIRACVKECGRAIVVFDGRKTYGFRSPIFLLDNVTIEGNGCHIVFPSNQSKIFSMDGVQAFLTNRTHSSIDGSINEYTTTILGSKNICIKNLVFANVNEMNSFGFNVNCERGFIALYGAENVQIDGIVAEDINTAHCAVWCINMKNFEVKNCSFSQNRDFNSSGAGGIWATKADYMHNVYYHHNKFTFYGDESINIEMATCARNNKIEITDNLITGSLLTVIHNKDNQIPVSLLKYSNNVLDVVTGVVDGKYQGHPRPLLISGDIDKINYQKNVISTDTSISLIRFYRPSHIKKVSILKNSVIGNVDIIVDNDAYISSCNVEDNNNIMYSFTPNASGMKKVKIRNNIFSLCSDVNFIGGEKGSNIIIKDNTFKSADSGEKVCILSNNEGKFRIEGNTFSSTKIVNHGNKETFIIRKNSF